MYNAVKYTLLLSLLCQISALLVCHLAELLVLYSKSSQGDLWGLSLGSTKKLRKISQWLLACPPPSPYYRVSSAWDRTSHLENVSLSHCLPNKDIRFPACHQVRQPHFWSAGRETFIPLELGNIVWNRNVSVYLHLNYVVYFDTRTRPNYTVGHTTCRKL